LTAPDRAAPQACGRDEETARQPNKETGIKRIDDRSYTLTRSQTGVMTAPDLGQPQSFLVLFFKKELLP
jgi:hypothetical protein